MKLDGITKETWIPRHLLLIGNTKSGKTRYIIEAIIDGYEVIYVDCDNGLSTIKEVLAGRPEILSRIHYFSPLDPVWFLSEILGSSILRYNETRHSEWDRGSMALTDQVAVLQPFKIPRRVLLVIDSWTAMAFAAMKRSARKNQLDLEEADKWGRDTYGPSSFVLTNLLTSIQVARFGVAVIAHVGQYERKVNPKGKVSEIKEKDMIIVESVAVPLSSSAPHGFTMGKFFTDIGNLMLTPAGRELSFIPTHDRISGGTPNKKGDPAKDMRFATLFGKPPAPAEGETQWIRYTDAQTIIDEAKVGTAAKPSSPVIPQAKVISGSVVSSPAATPTGQAGTPPKST